MRNVEKATCWQRVESKAMSLGCNSFNANKQEQDTKDLSFSRLLARGLEIGGDEGIFGRGCKRKRLVFVRTRLTPNISRKPLIGNPKHYDGSSCEAQGSSPSTTGAEYGYRGCFKLKSRLGKAQHLLAFTLAEILIALSIIGVVAALTIPSLIVKNQEKETVVRLKKAYNVFSNAFNLAVVEYGSVEEWNLIAAHSGPGALNILDKIAPYLNLMKKCGPNKGCFPANVSYKFLNGGWWGILDDNIQPAKAVMADGTSFFTYSWGDCNTKAGAGDLENICGEVAIDTNGNKPPNVFGKDIFAFFITKKGIMPQGSPGQTSGKTLETDCRGGGGYGCTAWVLFKENLEYPPSGIGWNN